MVRGKTQLRRIEDKTSRQVTFSKRRHGLLKKAFELSVLCDAEIALILFSPKGKLHEFASSGTMQETIERYTKNVRGTQINFNPLESQIQGFKCEAENMKKKMDELEASKRKLLGDDTACSLAELYGIEQQLVKSLSNIRAKKTQLFEEKIRHFKAKEKFIEAENIRLREKEMIQGSGTSKLCVKCGLQPQKPPTEKGENLATLEETSSISDMETTLFVSRPQPQARLEPIVDLNLPAIEETSSISYVETTLFIGQPQTHVSFGAGAGAGRTKAIGNDLFDVFPNIL